jgi:hypothetical protein
MEWSITMRGQALLAAGIMTIAVGLAAPASAQSYQGAPVSGYGYGPQDPTCKQRKTTNGVIGALVGGALGVVLGSNVYARAHKDDGRIVGGLAGAGVGAAIGASGTNCAPNVAYAPEAAAPPPATSPSYSDRSGGDDELLGGPNDDRGGYADDARAPPPAPSPRRYADNDRYPPTCRMVEEVYRDRWGHAYRTPVRICRDPYSGEWVVRR